MVPLWEQAAKVWLVINFHRNTPPYDRVDRRIDAPPETRWVVGSNNALLSVHLDIRTHTAVILVAIDNLVKGAAGQAVQCANLMFSLDEAEGRPTTGWMP